MVDRYIKEIKTLEDGQLNSSLFDIIDDCRGWLEDSENPQELASYLEDYIWNINECIDDLQNFANDLEDILDKLYKEQREAEKDD